MPVVIKLNVLKPEVQRRAEQAVLRGLQAMSLVAHREMQAGLSVPNTGERHVRTRDTKVGKKGSTYTTYPHPAKKPAPPRLRTGFLRSNVFREYSPQEKTVRLGVRGNAIYGYYLELGGWKWLVALLEKNASKLRAAFRGAAR